MGLSGRAAAKATAFESATAGSGGACFGTPGAAEAGAVSKAPSAAKAAAVSEGACRFRNSAGRAFAPWTGARDLAPWPGRSITAPCCCARRAPQQAGSAWQHGAALLCRVQQQPERNSQGLTRAMDFGPFLGLSGRAARRVARAPLRAA